MADYENQLARRRPFPDRQLLVAGGARVLRRHPRTTTIRRKVVMPFAIRKG